MGKLSNVFGILALLLAGGAAFLSFKISGRREEFRQRADKMAAAVVDIVKTVDEDSGTALASEVTFTPGDPKTRKKDSGSLSSVKFHEAKDESGNFPDFQEQIDKAVDHVDALAKRRNELAQILMGTVTSLGIPEDYLAEANLRTLADQAAFGDASQKVQSHADALKRRDDAMIEAIQATAQVLGEAIDGGSFSTRKQDQDEEGRIEYGDYGHASALNTVKNGVRSLNERAEAFGETIGSAMANVKRHEGIFEWSVDPRDVKSKNKASYDPAHIEFINDFVKLNEQLDNLVAARVELVEKKKRIDSLETDLSAANAEVKKAKDEIEAKNTEIRKLERELARLDPNRVIDGGGGGTTEREIEGIVRRVDTDYNYVILDLGKIDGLIAGTELLVARDGEYVAKVQVSEVLDTLSVADILPLAVRDVVKPDDQVILAVPAAAKPN